MQIETFKIFRDLVETGSFSKAAELNTITQSAVSQQIRALEKRFKTALIRRRKKNFSITPEGKALLQASQEILRTYENLGDRLRELKDHVSGNLVIATVHSIGLHELPRSLRVFRRAYPSVEVTVEYLRSAQVYQSVAAGNSDVGLVAYPARHRGVTVESHWKDKLVLICPPNHRFSKRRSIEINSLSGEHFISFAFDQPTRKAMDRIFRANNVTIRRSMEFDNIETVKRAVEIDNGVAIVPLASVEEETENGSLCAIEIESADMWRPIGLVQRRGEPSAAVRAFVGLLRKRDVL